MQNSNQIPRSESYKDKIIKKEGFATITRKGLGYSTRYYKREYTDESVELVRYDEEVKKWVCLLFPGDGKPRNDNKYPLIIEEE